MTVLDTTDRAMRAGAISPGVKSVAGEEAPSDSIRRIALAGWLIVAVFFGGIGAWAATAPLNGAVIGNAVVKVDGNRKSVQHLDGGIVKELRVKEGDRSMPAISCSCLTRPSRGRNTTCCHNNTWSCAPPRHVC